jgi:hypothetical protein
MSKKSFMMTRRGALGLMATTALPVHAAARTGTGRADQGRHSALAVRHDGDF